MAKDFDPALPSIKHVQMLIKEAKAVEVKLLTGDLVSGKISWQDHNCLFLMDQNNQSMIVWWQAIAYIKPKS